MAAPPHQTCAAPPFSLRALLDPQSLTTCWTIRSSSTGVFHFASVHYVSVCERPFTVKQMDWVNITLDFGRMDDNWVMKFEVFQGERSCVCVSAQRFTNMSTVRAVVCNVPEGRIPIHPWTLKTTAAHSAGTSEIMSYSICYTSHSVRKAIRFRSMKHSLLDGRLQSGILPITNVMTLEGTGWHCWNQWKSARMYCWAQTTHLIYNMMITVSAYVIREPLGASVSMNVYLSM